MKINVQIEVPEGKYCSISKDCKYLQVRYDEDEKGIYHCGLFDKRVTTAEKCPACLAAYKEAKEKES
jgi:hypothetical protein